MADRGSGSGKLLGIGCVLAALLFLCCGGGLAGTYGGVAWYIRGMEPYQEAVKMAMESEAVQDALGAPVETGFLVVGTVKMGDDSGTANISVPLSGPQQTGRMVVQATQTDGEWTYEAVIIHVDGAGAINLLGAVAEEQDKRAAARFERLLKEAEALARRGRHDAALERVNEAIAMDAGSVRAWVIRGDIHFAQGDLRPARRAYREALLIQPKHAEANRKLGVVYSRTKEWEACIDVFTEVLRADGQDGEAWYLRALCFAGNGERRKAAAGAREACNFGYEEGCTLARRLE